MRRRHLRAGFLLCCLLAVTSTRADSPAASGDSTKVSVTFKYAITSRGTEKLIFTVLVPKTIPGRQKLGTLHYSHRPLSEFEEQGSKYARFLFTNLSGRIELKIQADVELARYDFSLATARGPSKTRLTNLKPWLVDEKYLEKDAPEVKEAASGLSGKDELETIRAIMSFVQQTLTYSGYDPVDRGAVWALQKRRGDCSEYTDLFVAVCRAKKIPARVWEGYTLNEVQKGDTPRHAWAEAYTQKYGWIPFDPLHTARKSASFEKMKPIYLYMGSRRNDATLENYHYYQWRYWGNDVEVRDDFVVTKRARAVPVK
jgi:transglutaminase-like putative cysteine protease